MLGHAFDCASEYTDHPPRDSYLKNRLRDPNFIFLAALHEGRVVGGLVAYVLHKFEQERSEVYIYDLAVREACRRQGVATELIEALKPIARDCAAHVLFVQADGDDGPAIALYDTVGVRARVLHFDIPLT
ncbi:MAG: GNAT family N-acetyltransferase [Geminicoccaceae bacterium]